MSRQRKTSSRDLEMTRSEWSLSNSELSFTAVTCASKVALGEAKRDLNEGINRFVACADRLNRIANMGVNRIVRRFKKVNLWSLNRDKSSGPRPQNALFKSAETPMFHMNSRLACDGFS